MKYTISNRDCKKIIDGRCMINLGCGARVHPEWNNLDYSPYIYLATRPLLGRAIRACELLSGVRQGHLRKLSVSGFPASAEVLTFALTERRGRLEITKRSV